MATLISENLPSQKVYILNFKKTLAFIILTLDLYNIENKEHFVEMQL